MYPTGAVAWVRWAVVAGALAAWSPASATGPPDVEALLSHLDDLYRSKSSIARIEIQVVSPRTTRGMRLKAWTRGEDQVLVIIEDPPREAGTATLRVGENLWNYLPRIARTIRVPPSMMLGSWMGTDFTIDDLVKESSLRKDFISRVDRRSESPPGWWLAREVKPEVVGRSARIGSRKYRGVTRWGRRQSTRCARCRWRSTGGNSWRSWGRRVRASPRCCICWADWMACPAAK